MTEGFLSYDIELDVWFYVLPTGDRLYRVTPDDPDWSLFFFRPVKPGEERDTKRLPVMPRPPFVTDTKHDEGGYRLSEPKMCSREGCGKLTLRYDTVTCDYRHRHCRM